MKHPISIKLMKQSRKLVLEYDDGSSFELGAEYLRVYSPSAEVRGHGPGQGVLQTGKEGVNIEGIEPVGNYAIKLQFSDGHDTGLYSWDYLYKLSKNYQQYWQEYLQALTEAGYKREVQ